MKGSKCGMPKFLPLLFLETIMQPHSLNKESIRLEMQYLVVSIPSTMFGKNEHDENQVAKTYDIGGFQH